MSWEFVTPARVVRWKGDSRVGLRSQQSVGPKGERIYYRSERLLEMDAILLSLFDHNEGYPGGQSITRVEMDAPVEYYDQLGDGELERLERDFYHRCEWEETVHHLNQYLPEAGRVLDIGGEPGR